MSVSRKLCKGCTTHEDSVCLINPTTIRQGIKKTCPCIVCLIKGMCTRECKEYGKYEDFIKGRRDSVLNHMTNKENINQLLL